MTTRNYTESVCERCGVAVRRVTLHSNPPDGWGVVHIRTEGMSLAGMRKEFCPACLIVIEGAMGG